MCVDNNAQRPFTLILFVISLAFVLTCAGTVCAQQTVPAGGTQNSPKYDVVIFKDVMVPMRDGVKLACNIYRPALNGKLLDGKFPVILERTPYGKDSGEWMTDFFIPAGFVVVRQDVRGRFNSEGTWRFFRDDVNDGYDTAKWIADQPWSNGEIGTEGLSYPGGTQYALALSNPPYLKAMFPAYATSDTGHFGVRHNGAFELRWMNWIFNLFGPEGSRAAHNQGTQSALVKLGEQVREYAKDMPLRAGTTPLKLNSEYEDWLVQAMSHGDYDDFWKNNGIDVVNHVAEFKDVPTYLISGWFDSNLGATSLNYIALSKAKKSLQRLIIGPWWHGGQRLTNAGEAEFGPEAGINFRDLQVRWFDHWLKGIDNGIDREPPVRLFVMGGGDAHKTPEGRIFVGGSWRNEYEWPLTRAVISPYYLHAKGLLSPEKPGNETVTSFQSDPKHPLPTLGGNIAAHNGPRLLVTTPSNTLATPEILCSKVRSINAAAPSFGSAKMLVHFLPAMMFSYFKPSHWTEMWK